MRKRLLIIVGVLSLLPAIAGGLLKVAFPSRKAINGDGFQLRAIMDGIEEQVSLERFTHGSIKAIMAGIELDMRDVHIAPEGAYLKVTSIMAGVEIILPGGCRIEMQDRSYLGDIQVLRTPAGSTDDMPVLTIEATAVMAGLEFIQDVAWDAPPDMAGWPLDADAEPAETRD